MLHRLLFVFYILLFGLVSLEVGDVLSFLHWLVAFITLARLGPLVDVIQSRGGSHLSRCRLRTSSGGPIGGPGIIWHSGSGRTALWVVANKVRDRSADWMS